MINVFCWTILILMATASTAAVFYEPLCPKTEYEQMQEDATQDLYIREWNRKKQERKMPECTQYP